MSPTIEDLRDALSTAASDPHPVSGRLAGVRREVVRRRQRRTAGVLATVLALAAAATVSVDHGALRRSEGPARSHEKDLPEYSEGGRLIGQVSFAGRLGESRTFMVVPQTFGLATRTDCSTSGPEVLWISVTVNGQQDTASGCDDGATSIGGRGPYGDGGAIWRDKYGVQLGKPTSVTVTVSASPPDNQTPTSRSTAALSTQTASIQVGMYQDVPVADYPFPPRPKVVDAPAQHPDTVSFEELTHSTKMEPATPDDTKSLRVAYTPDLSAAIRSWAPGVVELLVNGTIVTGLPSWTYTEGGTQIDLTPSTLTDAGITPTAGEVITITARGSRFTDPAWRVTVGHKTG